MDSCADIECPFSGVTNSGRVWRKLPKAMLRVWSPLGVKSDTAHDQLRRANPTEGDGGMYKGAG